MTIENLTESILKPNADYLLLSLSLSLAKEDKNSKCHLAASNAFRRLLSVNEFYSVGSKFQSRVIEIVIDTWLTSGKTLRVAIATVSNILQDPELPQDFCKTSFFSRLVTAVTSIDFEQVSSVVFLVYKNQHLVSKELNSFIEVSYEKALLSLQENVIFDMVRIIGIYFLKSPSPIPIDPLIFINLIEHENKELSLQALKNIIFLTRKISNKADISIAFANLAKFEASNCSTQTVRREAFMKFLAATVTAEYSDEVLKLVFRPLVREIENNEKTQSSESLHTLASEVSELLQMDKSLGKSKFARIFGQVSSELQKKREQKRVQEKIEEKQHDGLLEKRKAKRNEKVRKRRSKAAMNGDFNKKKRMLEGIDDI